ncbi:DUF6448 family protein [Klebsiella variicola]|uniref:DUF6448 family protein n=1 Tax=Klebsiella variicola TaxID=244366 RepID=UPI002814B4C1|nr:DUF6448 family protein [Klebsiella variicola]
MPAFEWVHVQLHQQKGMISLSPPTICNSALRTNSVDSLVAKVTANIEHAIREKFTKAELSKQQANQSVKQGREYVKDYIHYIHFVEEINKMAEGRAPDTEHQH